MRTVALLRFLADSGLRARVTAATNKAEAYNGFSAWTPVRQPGRDRRERPGRAGKSVKWNSLLCNLIVFHTAIDMMEVIRRLVAEGWQVTAEDLAHAGRHWRAENPPSLTQRAYPTQMSAAGRSSGIGAGSMLAAARLDHPGARCRRGVGDAVGVEYLSRVPRPPLDGLIDDLYYLEGAPPYARLTLPPMPAALLIVNLGAPFRVRAGTDIETAEYADGCVVTMPTRAWEFGYPTLDPLRRRALQPVGACAVPADARGRAV